MKTSRVDQLISQATAPAPKVKASFNLDATLYKQFRALAEAKHLSQSTLIDALLEDLLARVGTVDIIPTTKRRGRKSKEGLM